MGWALWRPIHRSFRQEGGLQSNPSEGAFGNHYCLPSIFIAGLVPAIHLASAWTTGTSPVVTSEWTGRRWAAFGRVIPLLPVTNSSPIIHPSNPAWAACRRQWRGGPRVGSPPMCVQRPADHATSDQLARFRMCPKKWRSRGGHASLLKHFTGADASGARPLQSPGSPWPSGAFARPDSSACT